MFQLGDKVKCTDPEIMSEEFPTCTTCGMPLDDCVCVDDPGGYDEED